MHPDPFEFFRYRLQCLDRYFQTPYVLGVYDVAAWLRQLLLDETPLIDVVNRAFRLPIRFEVNTLPDEAMAAIRHHNGLVHFGAGLSPRVSQLGTPTRSLTRDQFLREPVLLTAHERITTRELILWAANEAGGVHYDPQYEGTSLQLNRLMRFADSSEHPVLGSSVIGIARIVRDAAEPLLVAVERRLQTGGDNAAAVASEN
jgi:hypothetical protein